MLVLDIGARHSTNTSHSCALRQTLRILVHYDKHFAYLCITTNTSHTCALRQTLRILVHYHKHFAYLCITTNTSHTCALRQTLRILVHYDKHFAYLCITTNTSHTCALPQTLRILVHYDKHFAYLCITTFVAYVTERHPAFMSRDMCANPMVYSHVCSMFFPSFSTLTNCFWLTDPTQNIERKWCGLTVFSRRCVR